MEQKDYILREIEKMGMMLRAVITKIFGGNANNAIPEEKQFEEVTEELLENAGFDLNGFIQMDDSRAVKYLEDRKDLNIRNLEDLALILEKLAGENRLLLQQKALLILEHCRDTDRTYSIERENRIGALKTILEAGRYLVNRN